MCLRSSTVSPSLFYSFSTHMVLIHNFTSLFSPLLFLPPSLALFYHLSCRSQVIIFNERDPSQELDEADSMCRQFKQSRLNHKCAARKSSVDDCLCVLPRERLVSKGKSPNQMIPYNHRPV